MPIEFIQCKNQREVEEKANALCEKLNDDVTGFIRSGFQKMSQRPEFQNFIQAVMQAVKEDNLKSITVSQKTEDYFDLFSAADGEWDQFTYPDQRIQVVGVEPVWHQLPSYFALEKDFSIFMYGLLEALNWTGGATVTFAERDSSLKRISERFHDNRDFLQFLTDRYGYHIVIDSHYANKTYRNRMEKSSDEFFLDSHVFYCGGFLGNGSGAKVCYYKDPDSPPPQKSLIAEIKIRKSSPPSRVSDKPDKPDRPNTSWY